MSKTLYVGNLSREITAESLRELFSSDGREVESVKLATYSKNGRPRGFGFVVMASEELAEAAMAAHQGAMLDGRPLKIGEGKDKKVETVRQYEDEYSGGRPRGGGGKRRR